MKDTYCRTLYFKAWVEDDIARLVYTVDELTLQIAKQAVGARAQISNGTEYPILADIRSIKSADAEARKFLSSDEATQLATAGAFIINNQFHRIIGNFFIQINKPLKPAKLFTSEAEALNWLQQFKKIRSTA